MAGKDSSTAIAIILPSLFAIILVILIIMSVILHMLSSQGHRWI